MLRVPTVEATSPRLYSPRQGAAPVLVIGVQDNGGVAIAPWAGSRAQWEKIVGKTVAPRRRPSTRLRREGITPQGVVSRQDAAQLPFTNTGPISNRSCAVASHHVRGASDHPPIRQASTAEESNAFYRKALAAGGSAAIHLAMHRGLRLRSSAGGR